jgi:hypothetical protein
MADLKVVPFEPFNDIPAMLRKLADEFESGEQSANRVTVIMNDGEVRNFGSALEMLAFHTVFDCQQAIFRVMGIGYGTPMPYIEGKYE